jgi:tRNA(fMet)-specific endonuclease VapC
MSLLLDTNICIAYLNGRDPTVREKLLAQSPTEVHLCSVVKAELLYGARNSDHVDQNLRRLHDFFEPLASLPFDDEAAGWYGSIRAQLRREGTPIGSNDLMIAAIALTGDLTVVTRNEGEFQRVPGLRFIVW